MSDGGAGPDPVLDLADADALARTAADLIAGALGAALAASGRASLAVAGGTTPGGAYRRLSGALIDWARVSIVPTDERWAPPSSPDSNERFLRESLLQGPAAAAAFTPLWSDAPTPDAAAARAEPAIAALTPLDVAVLGMGEDGHFASLFPGSPALAEGLDPEAARLCIGVPSGSPAPPQPRITLTRRAFQDARHILLLITGEAKRRVFDHAWSGGRDLPIRSLRDLRCGDVRVLWSP